MSGGPLTGIKVVELAGIGPAPFACMMLADMGAEVIQVERLEPSGLGSASDPRKRISNRGRRSIALDLKKPEAIAIVQRFVADADILVEGYRPGVAERLGMGPDECLQRNPRLVYGRMTGWGQDGPLSQSAAHDLNFIAVTGALHAIGPAGGPPVSPLNYVGDFGGGSLYLVAGVLAALVEARSSGRGQVVDAAIVDGAMSLSSFMFTQIANGTWSHERGSNLADGGRPWYDIYETSDGKFVSLAAIEGKFYNQFLGLVGLNPATLPAQNDPAGWPELRERLAALFRSRTREEWAQLLEGTDSCFAPVLTAEEAFDHPHVRARDILVDRGGVIQPAPAPRFSRTPSRIGAEPVPAGTHGSELLVQAGYTAQEIDRLRSEGVVA
ncbi:MAG: CaiB/BaiF CoA-transferase family protein [Sphingobium sp.]|nr:CaiB/BaiF CoA-transferase family protein [Sphingobium sp.]